MVFSVSHTSRLKIRLPVRRPTSHFKEAAAFLFEYLLIFLYHVISPI